MRNDPSALHRGGSDTRTGEGHMHDSAGRGSGLDRVVLLDALQSVPQTYAAAEQDRDHHDVHVIDEPGSEEVADHGGTGRTQESNRTSSIPIRSKA